MKRKTLLLVLLFLFAACFPVSAQGLANDGALKFDKLLYIGYGVQPVVTLVDQDLNTRTDMRDEISIIVKSSADPAGISVKLVEETANSGVFRVTISLSPVKSDDKANILRIKYNDTITAIYNDKENTSGKAVTRTCNSTWKNSTGTLEFNKSLYTGLYVPATVTLKDQDLNLNPSAADKARVTIISAADPKGIELLLNETSSNTGIFTGMLKFSTSVSSNVNSTIKVAASSQLSAKYIDSATFDNLSKTVMAEAAFRFTEAIVGTSAENDHGAGNMLDITIFEPDSNNPDRVDAINAKIGAGTSTDDLTVRLEETGINTGEFKQAVWFTDRESNKKLLYIHGSDRVNVKYTDQTIPQGGSKEIVKTIGWDYQSTVIKLDKERYEGYNSSAEIMLYNMELNDDSSEADRIYVDVEASNSKSIRLELKETKSNSGIFKGTLYFGEKTVDDENKLKMEDADSFTVSYTNKRNKSDVAECTADWSPQDGKLTLNKQVYYGNAAIVAVTLEDWDAAEDSSKIDDVNVIVRIQGTSRKRTITLKETKRDSGIFTETFYINGGTGKNPSIDVKTGETIEIAYTDEDTSGGSEETRTASAVWAGISEPELSLDMSSYKGYGSDMVITLKDPDYNKLINGRENVEVLVKTSAGGSCKYVLKETDADTGVFTASLKLTKDGVGYNYVKVGETETIIVTFVDKNVSVSAGFSK